MLFQEIPKLLQILLVKYFSCFILEEPGARFLADAEVQRVLVVRLLVKELWNIFKSRILLFLQLLFIF